MSNLDLLVTRLTGTGVLRAYKYGQVPASPTPSYCVLSLDTGQTFGARIGGQDSLMFRLAVQMFGTTDDAVRDLARLADLAFRSRPLTELPGSPFSRREIAPSFLERDPDAGGLLGLLHTYRF